MIPILFILYLFLKQLNIIIFIMGNQINIFAKNTFFIYNEGGERNEDRF